MIYTLTLNPSMDYYVTLNQFQEGHVNRVQQEVRVAGGKGINVSLVLRNFPVESTALGFLGGKTGEFIEEELRSSQIATDFIKIKEETRINVKIRAEQETEINSGGPIIQEEELQNLMKQLEQLNSEDIVVLAGSIPGSLPKDLYAKMALTFQQKGIKFIVDATKDAVLNVLQYHPYMIKPNHHELSEIFNVDIKTIEDAIPYAKQLCERGAQNVVVSFAGAGALLVNDEGAYKAMPPKGKLVNSVGAGDSLVAGFTALTAMKKTPTEAFRYGVTTGSASAYAFGLCTKEDVHRLIEEVNVQSL